MDGKDPQVVHAIVIEHVVADNLGEEQREKSAGKLVHEVLAVPVLDGTGPGVGMERRVGNRKRMLAGQQAPRHTGIHSQEMEELAVHHTQRCRRRGIMMVSSWRS